MRCIIVGSNQAGQRLDKYLHKLLPQAGNGFLYKMLRKKNITLNGKKAEGSEKLCEGDTLRFFLSEETLLMFSQSAAPSKADAGRSRQSATDRLSGYEKAYRSLSGITVLYEDEHILILDKPAGVLTQKAEAGDLSLNEWMIGYLLNKTPALVKELDTFRPSVCNRLDRNTSGIVLCGKSLAGLQYLSRCVKERSIRKLYRTICIGELYDAAEISGYLVKDASANRVTLLQTRDSKEGDYIETKYRPLCAKDGYTLLEVELITGKTHQIRAHLSGIGHPLIGDFKYGDSRLNRQLKELFGLQYQLLHAYRVVFPRAEEPAGLNVSGKTITAPCPQQFVRLQNALCLIKDT